MIDLLTLKHEGTDFTMASKRKYNTAHAHNIKKKKPATFKELPQEKQRLYKVLAIAAAVVLIVLVVGYKLDYLPHLDGSMNFRGGALVGAKENDLVINRESKYGANGEYYVVGSIDEMEGYVAYPELISSADAYRQAFSFKPENKEGTFLSSVVIQGCVKDYEELIDFVVGEDTETMDYSERFDGVSPVKGNVYHGGARTNYVRDTETGLYVKFINAYIENGIDDSCIMVQLSYKNAYKKEIPSDEQALEDLIKIIDKVNVK